VGTRGKSKQKAISSQETHETQAVAVTVAATTDSVDTAIGVPIAIAFAVDVVATHVAVTVAIANAVTVAVPVAVAAAVVVFTVAVTIAVTTAIAVTTTKPPSGVNEFLQLVHRTSPLPKCCQQQPGPSILTGMRYYRYQLSGLVIKLYDRPRHKDGPRHNTL